MKTLQFKKIKTRNLCVALLIATMTVISCGKVSLEEESNQKSITQKDIQTLKENHIIPLNQAIKQYDKYTKQRCDLLKDTLEKKYKNPKFKDSRSVWFDIKTIEAYIAYIKKTSKDPIEGLQFYFTVDLPKGGKKNNHQSFFIAPTTSNVVNGDTIQSGFTIKNDKRIFISEAIKTYEKEQRAQNIQKASFFSSMQIEDEGLLLNDGAPNPPGENN